MIAALIVVLFYLLSCLYQVIYQCIAVLGFQNPQDLHILRFLSSSFFFFSFPLLHMYLFGLKVMFQASSDILTVFHFCIKCRQTLQVLSGLYWSDNCVRLKAKKKKNRKTTQLCFICLFCLEAWNRSCILCWCEIRSVYKKIWHGRHHGSKRCIETCNKRDHLEQLRKPCQKMIPTQKHLVAYFVSKSVLSYFYRCIQMKRIYQNINFTLIKGLTVITEPTVNTERACGIHSKPSQLWVGYTTAVSLFSKFSHFCSF